MRSRSSRTLVFACLCAAGWLTACLDFTQFQDDCDAGACDATDGGSAEDGGGEIDAGSTDGGGTANDGGGGQTDAGGQEPDGGGATSDAGGGTTDAGGGTTDAGGGTTDAGGASTDGGSASTDGGSGSADAGSSSADGGTMPSFPGELGSNAPLIHPSASGDEAVAALIRTGSGDAGAFGTFSLDSPAMTGAINNAQSSSYAIGPEPADFLASTSMTFATVYAAAPQGQTGYYAAGGYTADMSWQSQTGAAGQHGFVASAPGNGTHKLATLPLGSALNALTVDSANTRLVAAGTFISQSYPVVDGGTVTTVSSGGSTQSAAVVEVLDPTTLNRTRTWPTTCTGMFCSVQPKAVGVRPNGGLGFGGEFEIPYMGTSYPFGGNASLPVTGTQQLSTIGVFWACQDASGVKIWTVKSSTVDQHFIAARVVGDHVLLVYNAPCAPSTGTHLSDIDMSAATTINPTSYTLATSPAVTVNALDVDSLGNVWVAGSYAATGSATVCGHALPVPTQGDDGFLVNCGMLGASFGNGVGVATWRGAGTQWIQEISAVSPTDVYAGGEINGATQVNASSGGTIASTNGGSDVLVVHYDH